MGPIRAHVGAGVECRPGARRRRCATGSGWRATSVQRRGRMCRFAAYLGEPVPIESVLYEPDRALVRQAVDSELMSYLNLGGFGLAAWNADGPDPRQPLTYRIATLPSFDRNL